MTELANTTSDLAESMTFSKFLEEIPPSQLKPIIDIIEDHTIMMVRSQKFHLPEIHLHCRHCEGERIFRHLELNDKFFPEVEAQYIHIIYACSNCQSEIKVFSLSIKRDSGDTISGTCYKLGEYPPFGSHVSARLLKLMEPEKELFLQGRRCEDLGFGIGAFAYYRRVVVNQKNRLLDKIIEASNKLLAGPEIIKALKDAKEDDNFSRSLETFKTALPEALLIDGQHNPLKLLHSALSNDLHNETDEYCLERAKDIRLFLNDLAERLSNILKKDDELNKALSRLLKPKNKF